MREWNVSSPDWAADDITDKRPDLMRKKERRFFWKSAMMQKIEMENGLTVSAIL